MSGELRLMSVHAHADDESITMGGLLAVCHDRGVRTANVCCTDGKLATIVAEDMPEETTRPHLAAIRQEELRTACGILGVDEVVFLEYGDSGMWGSDTNHLPDAFWTADLNEAVGDVIALTDADCTPDRDWLRHLVGPLADPTVGAVVGTVKLQQNALTVVPMSSRPSLTVTRVTPDANADSASSSRPPESSPGCTGPE